MWAALGGLVRTNLDNKLATDLLRATVDNYTHIDKDGNPSDGTVVMSDLLLEHLEKLAPKMAASMFERVFLGAVQRAKHDIMTEVTNKIGNHQ